MAAHISKMHKATLIYHFTGIVEMMDVRTMEVEEEVAGVG